MGAAYEVKDGSEGFDLNQIRIGRWRVRNDREATRCAYEGCVGAPEQCGCETCLNFVHARTQAYPAEALALFERLGIVRCCEAEVYHVARVDSGLHQYGGWFHFVGSIEEGADAMPTARVDFGYFDLEPMTERFEVGLTTNIALVPRAFAGLPVVQLEFTTQVPWVISAPEPN